jgi:hypothetical protein
LIGQALAVASARTTRIVHIPFGTNHLPSEVYIFQLLYSKRHSLLFESDTFSFIFDSHPPSSSATLQHPKVVQLPKIMMLLKRPKMILT